MTTITSVIVKWEGGPNTGSPVLFLPEYSANPGNIVCYAHTGQHSEASLSYYAGLRNPKGKFQHFSVNMLLGEYRRILDADQEIRVVSRDTIKFRKERYNHVFHSV